MKAQLSIGLPIYNGEEFLKEAIESLINQTFEDFEIVISDNASTDQTQQICRYYADLDPRIRYYRCKQNLGAAWNYNRVFELSYGEYFKWAAHDDFCGPAFFERCVDALDRDKKWHFVPHENLMVGNPVRGGCILGTVQETETIQHRILTPPDCVGEIIEHAPEGDYTIEEIIARVKTTSGAVTALKMYHKWPVRIPRPYQSRLNSDEPLSRAHVMVLGSISFKASLVAPLIASGLTLAKSSPLNLPNVYNNRE